MPVIASAGRWRQAGWFLQRIGAGWRWHVGGVDCDGGAPAPAQWTHLVATYDGKLLQLFQDGHLVGEKAGNASPATWGSALIVGQYSGGVAPPYQVFGSIADLRLYRRALPEEEALQLTAEGRPRYAREDAAAPDG